jgi:hypothetical protein
MNAAMPTGPPPRESTVMNSGSLDAAHLSSHARMEARSANGSYM